METEILIILSLKRKSYANWKIGVGKSTLLNLIAVLSPNEEC